MEARRILIAATLIATALYAQAQGSKDYRQDYDAFRKQSELQYDSFRRQCNEEYARFMENAWKQFKGEIPRQRPEEDKPVPPKPCDDGDKPAEDRQLPFAEIVPQVEPQPQPKPVEPIKEQPAPENEERFTFRFYGTEAQVRLGDSHRFRMSGSGEGSVAGAWRRFSQGDYDNAVRDCLALRLRHRLCDWAYLEMLRALGTQFFGEGTNEATMLTAYIYCQSGYKMRIGRGAGGRLYLLFASHYTIYGTNYFTIGGDDYYPIGCDEGSMNICEAPFPQEQPLSLGITQGARLDMSATAERQLQSERYPEVKVNVSVNKNLLDFYNSYPASELGGDFMTKWAMYADTPLDEEVQAALYPQLRQVVDGLSKPEAAARLLNFVQTAFVYEYDDKVWGADRAFFAEETLYYPYCDCEDRSILFSRLVRDLLGLDVVLVYYPGHLASAVCFGEDVTGDHLLLDGRRFTVCDPTYIGAGVGKTMPDMDNSAAKVILLN